MLAGYSVQTNPNAGSGGSGDVSVFTAPVTIYAICIDSRATGGNINLYDAADSSGTPVISLDGTANKGTIHLVKHGMVFKTACLLTMDINTNGITLIYTKI